MGTPSDPSTDNRTGIIEVARKVSIAWIDQGPESFTALVMKSLSKGDGLDASH